MSNADHTRHSAEVVGSVMLVVGAILIFGNVTGILPTFDYAGGMVSVIGLIILALSTSGTSRFVTIPVSEPKVVDKPANSSGRAGAAISLFLAFALGVSGLLKLVGLPMIVEQFEHWLFPRWFVHFTGAFELVAAGLIGYPRTRQLGSLLVMAVMISAIVTHLKYDYHRTAVKVFPALLLFAGAWYVHRELKHGVKRSECGEAPTVSDS